MYESMQPFRVPHRVAPRRRAGVAALVASVALLAGAPGVAEAASVHSARGATRRALVRAFVSQDGTSRGISGVFVAGRTGIVCQRTPDAGLVRFLFAKAGSRWRYAFNAAGTNRGTSTDRALERACR